MGVHDISRARQSKTQYSFGNFPGDTAGIPENWKTDHLNIFHRGDFCLSVCQRFCKRSVCHFMRKQRTKSRAAGRWFYKTKRTHQGRLSAQTGTLKIKCKAMSPVDICSWLLHHLA